jgi:hypothetical protein
MCVLLESGQGLERGGLLESGFNAAETVTLAGRAVNMLR